jgi:hypothetical protein
MKKTKKEEIIHTYVPSATNKMAKKKQKKTSSELNAEIPYIRHEEKINLISGLNRGITTEQMAYRGARF